MSQETVEKRNVVIRVERHKGSLMLPEGVALKDIAQTIQRQMEYEDQVVSIVETVDAFLWDGALAFAKAMNRLFGWSHAVPTQSFFGEKPPQLISVATGPDTYEHVPWGQFQLPGIEGLVSTAPAEKEGRFIFSIKAQVKRIYEGKIKELAQLTREIVSRESIYKGKAFRVRFYDEDGDKLPLPEPKFLDLAGVSRDQLIFSEDLANTIEDNLFTPIGRMDDVLREGVEIKRGVLLAGLPGVGKTLAALVAARIAQDAGVTFIYAETSQEFPDVLRFAMQYEPAVVFCEDIDRVAAGARTLDVDNILNIMDGVDSKRNRILCVLTTNDLDSIRNEALRPGRLDAVIEVEAPDAKAVEALIRLQAGDAVDREEDLCMVGEHLEGQIPAVIREVVKRAKLSAISRTKPGRRIERLTAPDLLRAAKTMTKQLALLARERQASPSEMEQIGNAIGVHIRAGLEQAHEKVGSEKVALLTRAKLRAVGNGQATP